jgi:hypothetical protein
MHLKKIKINIKVNNNINKFKNWTGPLVGWIIGLHNFKKKIEGSIVTMLNLNKYLI